MKVDLSKIEQDDLEEVRGLLTGCENLIKNRDYAGLYDHVKTDKPSVRSFTTAVLYASGIDPLKYMKEVPPLFLSQSRCIFGDFIIPSNIQSIGWGAFKNCGGLTSITIPNSVTSICHSAFYKCTGLTSITIPDSVKNIEVYAFDECTGLTAVYITDIANWCNISFDSLDANPLCYAHRLYVNGVLAKNLTIPNSVTSIGKRAFYNCTSLKSITIPDSVTSIGYYAFRGCTGLTDIKFTGTKEQWDFVIKGSDWNQDTGNYTIHCTDGDIYKGN